LTPRPPSDTAASRSAAAPDGERVGERGLLAAVTRDDERPLVRTGVDRAAACGPRGCGGGVLPLCVPVRFGERRWRCDREAGQRQPNRLSKHACAPRVRKGSPSRWHPDAHATTPVIGRGPTAYTEPSNPSSRYVCSAAGSRSVRRYRVQARCSWQTTPSSHTQNVGRWGPSAGQGLNAASAAPSLAKTVSHTSFW